MKFAGSAALGDKWGRLGYVVVIIKADLNLGCTYLKVLMALDKMLVKLLWSTGHSYYCGCNKPRCEEMYRRVVRLTKAILHLTTQKLPELTWLTQ